MHTHMTGGVRRRQICGKRKEDNERRRRTLDAAIREMGKTRTEYILFEGKLFWQIVYELHSKKQKREFCLLFFFLQKNEAK